MSKFKAVKSYDGNDYPDCIRLVPGDVIDDAVKLDNYWLRGTNKRTGHEGIFPRKCVEQIDYGDFHLSDIELSGKEDAWNKQTPSPSMSNNTIKFVSDKDTVKRSESNETVLSNNSTKKALYASTDKLFKSERGENKGLKAIAGVVASLLIGTILYILLIFSFDYSVLEATVVTIILTTLLAVSLGLSSLCRCAISLLFPNFFTGKGRAVLLSIIFGIILSGPITNITDNAKETGRSLACLTELATEQAKAVQQHLAVPISEVSNYVNNQKTQIRESLGQLGAATSFMDQHLQILFNTANDANDVIEEVAKKCKAPLKDVVDECKKVCAADILDLGCNDACDEINAVGSACDELKTAIGASGVMAGVNLTKSTLDRIRAYYKVDVEVTAEFNAGANASKSLNSTQKEINEDIVSKANGVKSFMHVVKKFLSLSIALLFIQSFWYLRQYLSKDAYDNVYITKQFVELDKQSKTPLLPLKKKEEEKYILTSSWKLGGEEFSHCKFGLVQVLLHFLFCFLVIVFDWAQYYILDSVGQYGDINISAEGRSQLNVSVTGKGPIADIYKVVMDSVHLDSNFNVTFNIKTCLPNPTLPSISIIPLFFILYIFALAFVFLRGYGMRLRRKIAAYFYPEQERERLEYLHKKIRHKRVGFFKFLRQQIQSAHKESNVKDKLRFSTWLMFHFPIFEKCITASNKLECTSCEQKDSSFNQIILIPCKGKTGGMPCDAVYCEECWTALNNACPICSSNDVVLRE